MDWLDATGPFWFALFLVTTFFNGRAAFKLLVDWKGMLTTCRFVEDAYAALDTLPDEAGLEHAPAAPVFVHLVPAYYEPAIAETLAALLGSRYPHNRLHVVVATREEEDRSPHPLMEATTAELVRRFRDTLPPWQQKMLTVVWRRPGRDARPTSSTGRCDRTCCAPCWGMIRIRPACTSASATPTRCPTATPTAGSRPTCWPAAAVSPTRA
jgi:hypothetical protein